MFLSVAILLLAVGASVLGLDTPDDCAVRAYVRAADLHQQKSRTARTSPHVHLSDCFSQVNSEAYRICLCATAKFKELVHHLEHGEVRPTTSRVQALARSNTGQIYGNGLIGWSCRVLARSRGRE